MDNTSKRSEDRLHKLQLTTSSSTLKFDEKIKAILQLGLESFELDVAILSNIHDNNYIVFSALSPNNNLNKGTKFELGDTYCRYTLKNGHATSIHHAAKSEWKNHPCYEKFQLEAYMGCPVYVEDQIFGTLNFSSPNPSSMEYDENDMEFLQLMAQWVGLELERQQSAEKLRNKNRLLAAISRTNEHFIANMQPQALFDKLLTDVLDLSDSEYGFIGEVLYTKDGAPYLKTHAISNIAWNEQTRQFYNDNAPNGLEFYNLKTLFGEVLRTGKIVISNDPSNDSRGGGLPEGHPAMHAFLGIPLYLADEFVGMAGVANREDGYDNDIIDYLAPLLGTCSNIINAYRVNRKKKETEFALRKSEERFQTIFHCAPFGVALINLQGYCHLSNNAFQKTLGYTQEELMSRPFNEFSHPKDQSKGINSIKELVSGGKESYSCERRYITKNGKTIWTNLALSIVRDAQNNPYNIIAMMHDVTKRKNVDSELKRFKTTLDQTLDCVFMFHPNNLQFFYVNQGAMDQVGYKYEELMQRGPIDIKPNVNYDSFMEIIDPLINGKQDSVTFETIHQHKNGTQIPVEIFLQYIAPDGEDPRFVAIVRDISERKKIDKMKNEFISTVSHELRTPLTSIRGSLGLIDSGSTGEIPEEMKPLISIAHRNAVRLILLINDILDMDKIASGNMQFHFQQVSLPKLLNQSIENNKGYTEQYSVGIRVTEPIVDVTIDVDVDRFDQVMSNLISNAAKFSPEKECIEITTALEQGQVKITVHDNGSGIPEEFQNKIFKKFTQADSSNIRQKGGTGLGLSITKSLVEHMNGNIGFNSDSTNGTNFYVILPVVNNTKQEASVD